ncbi:MAG TPA: hypothetical protein VN643_11100 [Pyrinomonadaceae bacterium]|nr:hypothetical protein [Pyrinomonadaceae bacterium]
MSQDLLHDLMERASKLTPEEQQSLVRFLSERANSGNGMEADAPLELPRSDPKKGQLSVEWLKAHADDYAGQHVALDGDKLVATGNTLRDAQIAASSNGYPSALLVHVPPTKGGSWGGW